GRSYLLCSPVTIRHTRCRNMLKKALTPTMLAGHSFSFNQPATTEIYTLSLHDALPIFLNVVHQLHARRRLQEVPALAEATPTLEDRKSTRLNSSHLGISYAVFCLKKKKGPVYFSPAHTRELLTTRNALRCTSGFQSNST